MTDLSTLPAVNASLNAASAFLLTLGYVFIRQRAITAHTMCMLAACFTSTLFLISYLVYHYYHGSTPFPGQGMIRYVYFAVLISHTILAVLVVPLAVTTLYRGLKGRFPKHVRIARLTLPLWLYVSVTGVLVYWMLYHFHVS
jgi:putative membrane protein